MIIHLAKTVKGDPAPYSLCLVSTNNDIEPRLVNLGEVSLGPGGQEVFLTRPGPGGGEAPRLTVTCREGGIQLREVLPVGGTLVSGWKP